MVCINSKKPDPFGHLIVTDANAAAQVFGWMVAGFGTGDWTGHGITSTIAATDPNGLLALGYANNIDLGASQFAGITLGNNDTIVKFTYYGDADLDGVVTLEDFSQFLYGYQQGGTPNWIDGDFDYSGTVTLEDFSLFLANHNTTPATPTYAIDGLDQTFTAGEEVTLSPRITNNIPLPAGTVFGWTVKQGNTVLFTSTGADFAYKLDENIAPTTLEVDLCVNNDEDHIISKTMDVDTPAGWTQVYDYLGNDVEISESSYSGVNAAWSKSPTTHTIGNGSYTLTLSNLPRHGWLSLVSLFGESLTTQYGLLEGGWHISVDGGEDILANPHWTSLNEIGVVHSQATAVIQFERSGLPSDFQWDVGGVSVHSFLPTVSINADKDEVTRHTSDEEPEITYTVTRTLPDELYGVTDPELVPSLEVPLKWSGEEVNLVGSSGAPNSIIIPAGQVSYSFTVAVESALDDRKCTCDMGDGSEAVHVSTFNTNECKSDGHEEKTDVKEDEPVVEGKKRRYLQEKLGILLQAWKQHPNNRDLAKIIMATEILLKKETDAERETFRRYFNTCKDSLQQTLNELSDLDNGISDKIADLQEKVEMVPELPSLPTEEQIRAAIGKANGVAEEIQAVKDLINENPASQVLEKLNRALELAQPFLTAANSDLDGGSIVIGMGELIEALNHGAPPGVDEILQFYAESAKVIGENINDICDHVAELNLLACQEGRPGTVTGPGGPFGPVWAQGIIDKYGALPANLDPMQWPAGTIPAELQPYLDLPQGNEGDYGY